MLPIGLQKQNFIETAEAMAAVPGWEMLRAPHLFALMSPVPSLLVEFVWGDVTLHNIEKAKRFFRQKKFCWILTPDQDSTLLSQAGFMNPIAFPEMLLPITTYQPISIASNIRTHVVTTENDLGQWAMLAAETFGFPIDDIQAFARPLMKHAGYILFLTYYDDCPVATSLVFCGKTVAGVYAMGVQASFRRKGVGRAALQACLQKAKDKNMTDVVLYASELGRPLYESSGFQVTTMLQEYLYQES